MSTETHAAAVPPPLAALATALRGPGAVGLVLGRAGSGKSTVLTAISLAASAAGGRVLHLVPARGLERIRGLYAELAGAWLAGLAPVEAESCQREWSSRRLVHGMGEAWAPGDLEILVGRLDAHLGLRPALVVLDGWPNAPHEIGSAVAALKARAAGLGAGLWLGLGREAPPPWPATALPADLVDFALECEVRPEAMRLAPAAPEIWPGPEPWALERETLRPGSSDGADTWTAGLRPEGCTLVLGGAPGAEEWAGRLAEQWGLTEVNLSFAGRSPARSRGLRLLGERELAAGEVSARWVERRLSRTFPTGLALRPLLACIWHQVSAAEEVFVVGALQPDGTVRGGTGWAVELARHWGRPVHVFDQGVRAWYRWAAGVWQSEEPPRVTSPSFTITGTARLEEAGREALSTLFARSFRPRPTSV